MDKFIIVSLGGSLIVPGGIDSEFLSEFRQTILSQIQKGRRFILIAGGGKISRDYQEAARKVAPLSNEDVDWLGIHVTHLNAHLLRSIFREAAFPKVITHYDQREIVKESLIIAGGWKPGHSTDFDAVMFAKLYGVETVINLSNIDFVYDKDPKKFSDASPIKEISWARFRKIVGDTWTPGENAPFDPIASKEAQKMGLKVFIMNGHNLQNFQDYLADNHFSGTLIH